VSRDRFDAKYQPAEQEAAGIEVPLPGEPRLYRNRPVPVLAKRMAVAFSIERSEGGDVLHGAAGDWLVQYAPGDHGIVAAARFDLVYRALEDPSYGK
jgi:hypothetical protein